MTTDAEAPRGRATAHRAYAASWLDRANAWVSRRPGPGWAYYAGLGLVLFLVQTGILWAEGSHPPGALLPIHAYLSGMVGLFPALVLYLDRAAEAQLASLQPLLKADRETAEGLRHRLTTLRPALAVLSGVAGAGVSVLLSECLGRPAGFAALGGSPVSYVVVYVVYVLAWGMWGVFTYHTIHQLHTIHLIYTRHTQINLFRVRGLYAFSGVTALTAVSLSLPPYGFLALNQSLGDLTALLIAVPFPVLGLVAFFWPQLGVRRLLSVEKGNLLDALGLRREAALEELRQHVDRRASSQIEELIGVLAALDVEEKALNKVSTWPWQPETMRYLVSALLLPLALLIAQLVLERVLSE